MSFARVVVVLAVAAVASREAYACSIHGSSAERVRWLPTGGDGIVHGLLILESFLVPPTAPTTCTAGIGLGTVDDPAPGGLQVTGLAIVVVNPADGSRTPLAAFSFASNAVTSAGLAAGSGSSVPNTNPLFAGSTWFGFSSPVNPFAPPLLPPGAFTAFEFQVAVAEALLPLTLAVQFAAGEGESSGVPIFTGPHPAQYFTAANPSVVLGATPAPALSASAIGSALALLAGVGLAGLARRRRG